MPTPQEKQKKTNKKFSRKNESLDPRKLTKKVKLNQIVAKSTKEHHAEKYVKKHKRADIAKALILTAAIQPERGTYTATMEAIYRKVIQAETPSPSTISRSMSRLVDPLWQVFKYYSTKLDRNLVPRHATKILVLDVKGIPTKIQIAEKGYVKDAIRKGIKLGILTVNGVPRDFKVSKGNRHDVNFLDYLRDSIGKEGRGAVLLLDSGFIDITRLAELLKAGVGFVCRARSNMRGDEFVEVKRFGDFEVEVWMKHVSGVDFRLFIYRDRRGSEFKILSSLCDPILVLRLYRVRWSIEILFRRLADLGFRLLGRSLEAVVVSVLVFLVALLVLRLYATLARRAFCVPCLRRRLLRWLFKFDFWYDVRARNSARLRRTCIDASEVLQK